MGHTYRIPDPCSQSFNFLFQMMAIPTRDILLVFQANTSQATTTIFHPPVYIFATFSIPLFYLSSILDNASSSHSVLKPEPRTARTLRNQFGIITKLHIMGSLQTPATDPHSSVPESSCAYLLQELKLIWDEVGHDQLEREKVILELEQECLEVYKRKVDSANISRARLHQALADSQVELTNLLISLGERSFPGRPEKIGGTLKEQLNAITPALHEMQHRKEERMNEFQEIQAQIQQISSEIAGQPKGDSVLVDEGDLSLKKLEEHQNELKLLLKEKSDRLQRVEEYIKLVHVLAATMGMDSTKIVTEVHPSLGDISKQSKNISDTILVKLKNTVELLKDEKQNRLEKLHKLGKALTNLWNLMDTTSEDRKLSNHIAYFSSSAAASDISRPGSLTLDIIHEVASEVERLNQLKASKMKELFLKKHKELEEICKKSHMEMPSQTETDNIMNLITAGDMDHNELLKSMEEWISKAKEEASSRKDIMEKVEKWIIACDEERWLEEYSRDENRYSVRRGAHKNLKRAERARIMVNKIPALVELMMTKTKIWEEERKKRFLYDEVPLLAMLEEYNSLRQEKEEEKHRQRERKKVQLQVVAEHEKLFNSRPSTSNPCLPNRSLNRSYGNPSPSSRKLNGGSQFLGSDSNNTTRRTSSKKEGRKTQKQKMFGHLSNASLFQIDTVSEISATFSGLSSP